MITEITYQRIPDAEPTKPFKSLRKPLGFVLETDTLECARAEAPGGRPVSPIASYVLANRRLSRDGLVIAPADKLLYQCRIGEKDIVVIERSRVSANPAYWFIALTGHPVQLGDIWVLSFAGGQLTKKSLVLDGSKAVDWTAVIAEQETLSSVSP